MEVRVQSARGSHRRDAFDPFARHTGLLPSFDLGSSVAHLQVKVEQHFVSVLEQERHLPRAVALGAVRGLSGD